MMRPLLLFVVTEDYYFLSHRLPQARAAAAAGFSVGVIARDSGKGEEIEAQGYRFFPVDMSRGSVNPLQALRTVISLTKLLRRHRPDVVHTIAMKGIALGAAAAWLARVPQAIHAVTGLGATFLAYTLTARLASNALLWALRTMMRTKGWIMLFQNVNDKELFVQSGVVSDEKTVIIRGSGVDTDAFSPSEKPTGTYPLRAVFAARMLRDKGITDLAEAAYLLRKRGTPVEFHLCGQIDPANPASLDENDMNEIASQPSIHWLGQVDDMRAMWAQADIAVLPSRREGLPKTLLEAAACGVPLVATDVPGCREIVQDGINGFLVPWNDPAALAEAIDRICRDEEMRREFGRRSRRLVEENFSSEIVFEKTKALYERIRSNGSS